MSIALTGRDLVTRALKTIGVIAANEVPNASDARDAFDLLNELVDSWAIQALTIPTVNRDVYNLVSGQGGPDNPYTYGPGGDWDTGAAARPLMIQDANLVLNTSTPAVEIPLAVLSVDMYAATPIKGLENALPVSLYYNPSSPLAEVFFWPIPTEAANQVAVYVPVVMPAFATLNTLYVCPPGYLKAFRLCLADVCVSMFAVPADIARKVHDDAHDAFMNLKASNAMMADLSIDPAFTPNLHGTYVIQTDEGA